jgi:hypothetical protein
MNTEIYKYIDFKSLFEDLYKEKETELEEEKYVADHYKYILDFYSEYKDFELLKEECELGKASILFVFYQQTSFANESNPDTDGIIVSIVFDTILDEFVSFETE